MKSFNTIKHWLWLPVFGLIGNIASAATESVVSPDGNIIFTVNDDAGIPHYSVNYKGGQVLAPSALGLEFKDVDAFVRDLKISAADTDKVNNTWEQPWGERRLVKDQHNELLVTFVGLGDSKKI